MNSLKEKDIKVFVGGVHKPFQDCRFSLRSKRFLRTGLSAQYFRRLPYTSTRGLSKPFQLNATHFVDGVFICVRVCEQAHTASTNKNPVTFVTGFVPRTGIEPALPCDNQILSLARLPVPPSGPLY